MEKEQLLLDNPNDKSNSRSEKERLESITNDLKNLHEMQTDLNEMIHSNTENLEYIDNNFQKSLDNIQHGENNLEDAVKHHNRTMKWKAMVFGGTMGAVVLGPVGAGAIFGAQTASILLMSGAGLVLGGGLGKVATK